MEPVNYLDDPRLGEARNAYQDTARQANEAQAYGLSLPDMLNDALKKKFSTNNPLVADRESLLNQYMSTFTQSPLDVTSTSAGGSANVVYNPMEQSHLIQAKRSAPLSALTTANYLLGLNEGGIQNVQDSTSRLYNSGTQRLLGEAELKRTAFQDLLSELTAKQEQAFQERQFQEGIRQFDAEQLAKLVKGSGTGSASDKKAERSSKATDEALAQLQADVAAALQANPNADRKSLVQKWIKANEPYFPGQGVDGSVLWNVYNLTPAKVMPTVAGIDPMSLLKEKPKPGPLDFLNRIRL